LTSITPRRSGTERHERDQILSAIGSFRDPAIERRALTDLS
jgi:hypothetical protein